MPGPCGCVVTVGEFRVRKPGTYQPGRFPIMPGEIVQVTALKKEPQAVIVYFKRITCTMRVQRLHLDGFREKYAPIAEAT